jgi:hypothetical protein
MTIPGFGSWAAASDAKAKAAANRIIVVPILFIDVHVGFSFFGF